MEASVAIIQHRSPCYSNDRMPSSPHDYDIIVLDEPSRPSTSSSSSKTEQNNYITKRSTVGNHAIGQTVIRLPYFGINNHDSSLSESVLDAIYTKSRLQLARAVPVPLFDDRQRRTQFMKQHVAPGTALMCVPVSSKIRLSYPYGRFENLARLVNLCMNTPEVLDVRTRHMILRLDEWLSHSQRINPHFLASLFFCDSSKLRIICCVHNPAYVHDSCIKYMNKKAGSTKSVSSSIDLDEKVRFGNLARVQMMQYNKYNILIMNPLFGLQLPHVEIPKYFILGSEEVQSNPTSDSDFALRYPLHNAALTGDQQTIRSLIAKNYDVNERDRDGWTPLHYSCFYNQISATDALLTAASADVNMRNKGGATALHISSINGNKYITELLLSHPRLDINILNNDGLKAIDLCDTLPKTEYKECARLIKEAIKPEKIQIDLMDGGALMVLLINGKDTKANEILNQISLELHISREALSLFGLWIYSDSLALQLKSDAKIWPKMKDWSRIVTKICRYEQLKEEEAKLIFRRNAHASLRTEIEVSKLSFSYNIIGN
ncbi:unnamed protein product [Auanema sp. JU1783]|nr:unnamed protein product [Auanema sp. JU1783]